MLGKCPTLGLQPIKLQPEPLFCCFWVLRQDLIRISQVDYTICCVAECGTQLLILLLLLPGCCQAHTTIALMRCWGLSPGTCERLLAELCMHPLLQFWLWGWCQLLHSPAALAFEAHRFLLTLSPLTLFHTPPALGVFLRFQASEARPPGIFGKHTSTLSPNNPLPPGIHSSECWASPRSFGCLCNSGSSRPSPQGSLALKVPSTVPQRLPNKLLLPAPYCRERHTPSQL